MRSLPRRRTLILAAVIAVITVTIVAVGVYGLIRGPGDTTIDPTPARTAPAPTSTGSSLLPTLAPTGDPIDYATRIAHAVPRLS